MTFVKIGDQKIVASVSGTIYDRGWDGRASKSIQANMTYEEAKTLFADGVEWAIVYEAESYPDENGDMVTPDPVIYDNSEYSVSGPITDNRDGTVTVKMGKITDSEALAELMEALGV